MISRFREIREIREIRDIREYREHVNRPFLFIFSTLLMVPNSLIPPLCEEPDVAGMNYRITRLIAEGRVVFRVSGRMQWHTLDTLRELIGQEKCQVAMDLKEVSLVDRETVMFLAGSESSGIELRNCPTYIREWIDREKQRIK